MSTTVILSQGWEGPFSSLTHGCSDEGGTFQALHALLSSGDVDQENQGMELLRNIEGGWDASVRRYLEWRGWVPDIEWTEAGYPAFLLEWVIDGERETVQVTWDAVTWMPSISADDLLYYIEKAEHYALAAIGRAIIPRWGINRIAND